MRTNSHLEPTLDSDSNFIVCSVSSFISRDNHISVGEKYEWREIQKSQMLISFWIQKNLLKFGKYSLRLKFKSSNFESIDELGKFLS